MSQIGLQELPLPACPRVRLPVAYCFVYTRSLYPLISGSADIQHKTQLNPKKEARQNKRAGLGTGGKTKGHKGTRGRD